MGVEIHLTEPRLHFDPTCCYPPLTLSWSLVYWSSHHEAFQSMDMCHQKNWDRTRWGSASRKQKRIKGQPTPTITIDEERRNRSLCEPPDFFPRHAVRCTWEVTDQRPSSIPILWLANSSNKRWLISNEDQMQHVIEITVITWSDYMIQPLIR